MVAAPTRRSAIMDFDLNAVVAVVFTERPSDLDAREFCDRMRRSAKRQLLLIAAGPKASPWMTFVERQTSVDGVIYLGAPPEHQIQVFGLLASLRAEEAITVLGDKASAIWHETCGLMRDIDGLVRGGQPVPRSAVHTLASTVVEQADDALLFDIVRVLRRHHSETLVHSLDMAIHALLLGRHVGVRSISDHFLLFQAGLLHDIGKAEVPPDILSKPGKLTHEEIALIREHPLTAERILRRSGDYDELVIAAAVQHHEKNDGTGYPFGLSSSQIGEIGRLTAVCDVYSALTELRAYKRQSSPHNSFDTLRSMAGPHLDPVLVERMIEMVDGYTGSTLAAD